MMKFIKSKISKIALIIVVVCCSYYLGSSCYVSKHEWKNSQYASVGDFLVFEDSIYTIKWGVIYNKHKYVGNLIFCIEDYLIVYSRNEKGFGFYCKKR